MGMRLDRSQSMVLPNQGKDLVSWLATKVLHSRQRGFMSNSKMIAAGILAIVLVGCANTRADQNTQRPGDRSNAFVPHSTPAPEGPVPGEMAGNTLPEAPGYGMMIPDTARTVAPAKTSEILQARR
jgi:hypothetical protein